MIKKAVILNDEFENFIRQGKNKNTKIKWWEGGVGN